MNCDKVRNRLIDYLDGLPENEAGSIARHIGQCEGCRREYRDLRDTIRMVKDVRVIDPGPAFWQENRERIKVAAARAVQPKRGVENAFGRRRLIRWLPGFRTIFALNPYRLAGGLAILLFVVFGLRFLGRIDPGMDKGMGEDDFVLDADVLGRIYLSGALSFGDPPMDELGDLTEKELGEMILVIAYDFGTMPVTEEEEIFLFVGEEFDIENEIRRLDSEELIRLLWLVERSSITS